MTVVFILPGCVEYGTGGPGEADTAIATRKLFMMRSTETFIIIELDAMHWFQVVRDHLSNALNRHR
jgi:hypothetical protein